MSPEEVVAYIDEHTGGLFKCFYFKDTYDFASSGVSDNLVNLIYVRPLVSTPSKYIFRTFESVRYTTAKYRLVVQTQKKFTNVVKTMLNILSTVHSLTLISYTDDTDGVYAAEYNNVDVIRDFDLHAFDFELDQPVGYTCKICECIVEKTC